MESIQHETNFSRFTDGPVFYYKMIGMGIKEKQTVTENFVLRFYIITCSILILQQAAFLVGGETSPGEFEFSQAISNINYCIVGFSKLFFMIKKRSELVRTHENFRKLAPLSHIVTQYKLGHYLRTYKVVELLLSRFYYFIILFIIVFPLVQSFYDLWSTGNFGYKTPLILSYPIPLRDCMSEYVIYYALQVLGCPLVGMTGLCCDLYLFASVSQLCLHFDLMSCRIMEIEPEKEESLTDLVNIARQHQTILRLTDDLNNIFTPSIILSLLSSTLIICFNLFQLLDDLSAIALAKAVAIFFYELKQVVVVCYIGDKLMEASANMFDAIYMHDWLSGSFKYKRTVLFMMMHTLRPKSLMVAGVANVSLNTLKKVLSMSYQLFAVLKNT